MRASISTSESATISIKPPSSSTSTSSVASAGGSAKSNSMQVPLPVKKKPCLVWRYAKSRMSVSAVPAGRGSPARRILVARGISIPDRVS
jgi:hypothetical protein